MGFGSKFTPAATRDAPPHAARTRSFAEPAEPGVSDNASDWRTGPARRPSASPAVGEGMGRGASFSRRSDATEVDDRFASQERMGFGSKFTPTPPESPSGAKRGFGFDRRGSAAPSAGGEEPENWRNAARKPPAAPSRGASTDRFAPATPAAPVERKKLELKPRGSGEPAGSPLPTPTSGRANPFGDARPVDASERERQIEERLRAERDERAKREKERKEEERKQKEQKEKARPAKGPAGAPTGPRADREKTAAPSSAGSESGKAEQKTEAVQEPVSAAAATPKSPPPVGAWGKGRAPSGALVGEAAKSGQDGEPNGTSADAAEEQNKAVDEAAEGIKVSLNKE